ncbi:hypothetical protein, partial [Roseovarius sp. SYSU LYC5161]|uniref:hypothetical protein n=1 Tax=Roseovarius halophilus (ex Wu et al. 2025) TaxID=3376060 RepID=UPI00399C3C86
MTAPILARNAPSRPALPVLGDVRLPLARLHEVCGPARHVLAMLVAAAMRGPVFWIAPAGRADGLNPEGMVPFTAPQRFTFVSPDRPEDVLWTLEETLRSGVVPLVVGDLPAPPPLTPVRRLHLAAEAGAAEGGQDMPLGLVLTPGAESRVCRIAGREPLGPMVCTIL